MTWVVRLVVMVVAGVFFCSVGASDGRAGEHSPRKSQAYRQGEVLVKFKDATGLEPTITQRFHSRHKSNRIRSFRHLQLERVGIRAGQSVEDAIREFQDDPDVEYVEPNHVYQATVVPSDQYFSSLWGMMKAQAPAVWDTVTGSHSVVVGIIDSGIDYTHPDLKDNILVNSVEQNGNAGLDNDKNGYIYDVYGLDAITYTSSSSSSGVPLDDYGHGTHVAGIIGAIGNNGTGVTGVNWKVKMIGCKFLNKSGLGYTSDAIDCLTYFRKLKDRGVNIVATNNSWGGAGYSLSLYNAIQAQKDILFIAAAGNSGTDNDAKASYPANYDLPNVIAVAATDSSDSLASFSQYGRRTVDVAAPGVNIYSTYPGGAYASMNGTSMAAAYVTGLAALIKSAQPDADWRTVKNLILSTGDSVPALTAKTVTGKRINAVAALSCLDSRILSALKVPASVTAGVPATLSALSLNCGNPLGPVTVSLTGGEVVELKDDGIAPDQAAGDGVFTVKFTPVRSPESYYFSSPAGSESIGNVPLSVATASLPNGSTGVAYSQSLAAWGGTAPYVWSLIGGALPAGLSLDSGGTLSGTPSVYGSFPFTVQVSDSKTANTSKSLIITIDPPPLSVITAELPSGMVNALYSQPLAATGGISPYTWSISAGALPAGVTLSSGGVMGGIPMESGTFTVTVQVIDARAVTAQTSLSVKISAVTSVPAISTSVLPSVTAGVSFSTSYFASGGTKPYVWSVAGASLPAGLALSASGVLRGSIPVPGQYKISVQVTDVTGASAQRELTLSVNPAPLVITKSTLLNATAGVYYWVGLAASGGTKPYSWSIQDGNLPAGIVMSAAGVISGTTNSPGTFPLVIQVTDASGVVTSKATVLAVGVAPLTVSTVSLTNATTGVYYWTTLKASGGVKPYTWEVPSSSLPTGMTFTATTGALSGRPTVAGTYSLAIIVRDTQGSSAEQTLTLIVQ